MSAAPDIDRWPHLHATEDLELAEQEARSLPHLIAEWRRMRAEGVMPGSSARCVAKLREVLLAAGCWVVVNE